MQTTNEVDENIRKIGELFPNCLTEVMDENGQLQSVIDFDLLRQELANRLILVADYVGRFYTETYCGAVIMYMNN